jgi:drug/metabolite transporter (DMT)-like permease
MNVGWIYLLCVVAAGTLLWPVGRWALQDKGSPAAMGFWISLVMGILGLIARVVMREPAIPQGVWTAGLLTAFAYSIGFCLLIMQCLKIGPAGPTVTVNNMAMVCGVLYGAIYLHPAVPSLFVLLGATGTCAALILIGMGQQSSSSRGSTPRHWLPMLLAGGAFSGLSFMMQTHIGELYRGHRFSFLAISAIGSAIILLPFVLREGSLSRQREIIAGLAIGGMSVVSISLTLSAFQHFPAAIVLPFTVTSPVLLMLIIGHFGYRERLNARQLSGTLVGAASILLLALGSI